jgi:hypothetical protein
VVNRREFLILGTGFGLGNLGFSRQARAEAAVSLFDQFPRLVAQVPGNAAVLGRHSGFMVQSDYGTFSNNYEAVFPSLAEGLTQVYRDNAQAQFPWIGPLPPEYFFACSPQGQITNALHGSFFGGGEASEVGLIQSNFTDFGTKNGHLELVVRHGDRIALYWRASNPPLLWTGPLYIPSGQAHRGNPALVQGTFGAKGNFEVVVPHAQSGLVHYTRFNDLPGAPWSDPTRFAEGLGLVDAVALLQSDYVDPGETSGHLEVIARVGGQLFSLWRASQEPYGWTLIPQAITDGVGSPLAVAGVPGFVQTTDRDYHVVAPLQGGGLVHLRRQNSQDLTWTLESQFAADLGPVAAVSLLQNRTAADYLEILTRKATSQNQFEHFFATVADPVWAPGGSFAETQSNGVTQGQWQVPYSLDFGTVGIHAALLPTGRVLFVGYEDIVENENSAVSILDPEIRQQVSVLPNPQRNKFCCGHAFLADGRLVLASGNVGETSAASLHTFTPQGDGGSWSDFGAMSGGVRWYPTCTTLPDGRVLILAGTAQVFTTIHQTTCSQDFISGTGIPRQVNKTYEIFDGTNKGPSIPVPELFDDCEDSLGLYGLYPFVFVLPDGRLMIHGNTRTYFLDVDTNTVTQLPARTQIKTSRTYPSEGSAVLLPLRPETNYQARVMVIGGGVSCSFVPSSNPNCGQGTPINMAGDPVQTSCQGDFRDDWPATNTCEVLDLNAPDQGWQFTAPMANNRVLPDAVLLPDGTVFVCGGSSTGTADATRAPVLEPELYNPTTNQWTPLAAMHVPRLYHAAAILLPSGEVMTSGTDKFYNVPPFDHAENRVEVFKPPYLFKGPQPVIGSVTNQVGYGELFSVFTPDAETIASACFMAPGASTHSFNMQQRLVGLEQVGAPGGGELLLKAPPSGSIAPPGYYMLFLVNQTGVPSKASFVRLG